ncbi:MAG TPA: YlmC/YmxH family sporulation protein [Verrucomicrobiae bacterium]|nr:YlmC/YmxH family sporulation protein [Verrucomicrobiae bacterium]
MLRISDLRMRDVVNVSDGRRLGFLKDIDIDLELGKIKSLVLPGQTKVWSWFGNRTDDIVIPWDKIKKIGVDVILVDASTYLEPKHRED